MERPELGTLVRDGVIDAQTAALVSLLAENGVPLVVAAADATDTPIAEKLRAALGAVSGGTLLARSLEDVLRFSGATALGAEVPDAARDLGLVVVVGRPSADRGPVVVSVHYVRPVERDAAGHLQRRPPALLAAIDERSGRTDHFFWAITDELATRAEMDAAELDDQRRDRARILENLSSQRDAPN
jgi:hypothetical protein